jgi:hypothetical protein
MPTAPARIAALGLAITASALVLAGCSITSTSESVTVSQAPDSGTGASSSADAGGAAASGEMYGCTDDVIAFLTEHGYPDPVPQSPSTPIEIGGVTMTTLPVTCLIRDEYGGYPRYAAYFAGADTTVYDDVNANLTNAGYVQSDEYGPWVWWLNGEGPTSAEHAVGAGQIDIAGAPYWGFSY